MARKRKTADDLVQSNEEYVKLKGDQPARGTPRETPEQQAPGEMGYGKPEYARWTVEELRDLATRLGIENVDGRSHEELVRMLEDNDALAARSASSR